MRETPKITPHTCQHKIPIKKPNIPENKESIPYISSEKLQESPNRQQVNKEQNRTLLEKATKCIEVIKSEQDKIDTSK